MDAFPPMVGAYPAHAYAIPVCGQPLRILGPADPHGLHRLPHVVARHKADGYSAHWGLPWPAAVMLAEHVINRTLAGPAASDQSVLELGAGLGIAGLALTRAGFPTMITDYDEDALAFVRASADLNGLTPRSVEYLDWREPPSQRFAVIVSSDCVYDRGHHKPILALLDACLAPGGIAVFSDMNRRASDAFPDTAERAGYRVSITPTSAPAIPGPNARDGRIMRGRIFELKREESA